MALNKETKTKLIPFLLIAVVGIGLALWLSIDSKKQSPAAISPLKKERTIMEKETFPENKIILSKENAETIATLASEKPMPANIQPLAKDDIAFLSENDIIDEKESETLLEVEDLLKGEK